MIGIYVNNVTVRLSVCLLLTFFPYKTPNKCYTHISDRFSICGKPPAYKCTKHIKLMCHLADKSSKKNCFWRKPGDKHR